MRKIQLYKIIFLICYWILCGIFIAFYDAFFAYDALIKSKQNYYQSKYGIVPEFKAGLLLGNATIAEVGIIKKELEYHGDVLNTAARIQGKCNDFQKRLLISESMKIELENQHFFDFSGIGSVSLKGKTKSLNLYEVKPV